MIGLFLTRVTLVLLSLLGHFAVAKSSSVSRLYSTSASSTNSKQYLNAHNEYREAFNAPKLAWSEDLADKAYEWANTCQFEHSGGHLMTELYGENLAAGAGTFTPAAAVKLFAADISKYNPEHPSYNQFTQLVWKSSTSVGCAVAQCDNLVAEKWGMASYHVCLYNPVGNVVGQAKFNVQV